MSNMLRTLSIKNFAIIADMKVSFNDGFTVLTGQTGAGKSLIIDSLSLLLGERAATELIRTGEEKATVLGTFEINKDKFRWFFDKYQIEPSSELMVERSIGRTRSVVRINGTTVPLNTLQEVAPYLADIHDQFDFYKILNPENYLSLIDSFDNEKILPLKNKYQSNYLSYKEKNDAYLNLIKERDRIKENKDFYEYQYKELDGANLIKNEDKDIQDELEALKNFDKIYSLSEEAKKIINGSSLDNIYDLIDIMKDISKVSPSYKETAEELENKYYEISDICSELKKDFSHLEFDPDHMEELNERDAELSRLKRKYKKNLDELIEFRDNLKTLLASDSDVEIHIEKAEKELRLSKDKAMESALKLSKARKEVAKLIEKRLEGSLKDLLLSAKFSILFINENAILSENGIDEVDFYIETNAGEGLKPLAKIVSGGEASRIMLAFKEIFIKANKVPTVVFDEIDTGISGEAAEAVAKKIYEISKSSQVIAITHLPQVAAYSTTHMLITKKEENGRTYANIKVLTPEEKIREIAKLISDGDVTSKQLEYAKELVEKTK